MFFKVPKIDLNISFKVYYVNPPQKYGLYSGMVLWAGLKIQTLPYKNVGTLQILNSRSFCSDPSSEFYSDKKSVQIQIAR